MVSTGESERVIVVELTFFNSTVACTVICFWVLLDNVEETDVRVPILNEYHEMSKCQ